MHGRWRGGACIGPPLDSGSPPSPRAQMSLRSSQSRRQPEASDAQPPAVRPPGCFTRLLLPAIAVYFIIRAIGAFARPDYLPTHDGPHHILSAWLLGHAHDAGAGYLDFLTQGRPLTALGFLSLPPL